MNYLVNTLVRPIDRVSLHKIHADADRGIALTLKLKKGEGDGGSIRVEERFFTVEKPWRGGTVADERDGRSIPRRTDVDINNDPRTFV